MFNSKKQNNYCSQKICFYSKGNSITHTYTSYLLSKKSVCYLHYTTCTFPSHLIRATTFFIGVSGTNNSPRLHLIRPCYAYIYEAAGICFPREPASPLLINLARKVCVCHDGILDLIVMAHRKEGISQTHHTMVTATVNLLHHLRLSPTPVLFLHTHISKY